jgi:dihydrofolate reductase
MKLTVTTFQTLDGVMQAPGGPDEDRASGFEHGGWLVPHADDGMGAFMDETFERADAFLLGRSTYEVFAAYWPHVDEPGDPISTKLNALPKYVASRTLREQDLDWHGATLLGDDVPARVAALKEQPGRELQVHGSAGLVQTLLRHGLVDELRILTFPVVLGSGKRLFGDGTVPAGVRLTESRTTGAGTVIAVYAVEGTPSYGTFGLEDGKVVAADAAHVDHSTSPGIDSAALSKRPGSPLDARRAASYVAATRTRLQEAKRWPTPRPGRTSSGGSTTRTRS